jgi:hypothetical protein
MSDIDNFVTLFRGRGDCYGSDDGGCVRKPLERQTFVDHLEGKSGIGVYPAVPSSTPFCVWGCSDIDVEDLPSARLLQRTLKTAGVMSWVERSRSKGYHVWVFAEDRVPAEDMRRMLLAAHQVADYPAREVNPKQSDVSAHKVGNYVRLPYLGGLVDTPQRRVILDDHDTPMPLDVFVYHAIRDRTPVERIQFLASHYVPPARVTPSIDFSSLTDEDLEEALRTTSPLARVIWKQGPLESQDRSTALMRLAHVCFRSGVTPSMCRVIVVDADKRWGKYHLRGDAGQAEINKIVERAYRG